MTTTTAALLLLVACCCCSCFAQHAAPVEYKRVKLSDVKVMTLFKDRLTAGRRLSGVPQLKCVSYYFKCSTFEPSVVQCTNKGTDGTDVHWECSAELDKRVKFGELKVTCEGFDSPNDLYILADSCGLEYTLEASRSYKAYSTEFYNKDLYETSKLSNFLTLVIMVVIILAVYKSCSENRERAELQRRDLNGTFAHVVETVGLGGGGGGGPAGVFSSFGGLRFGSGNGNSVGAGGGGAASEFTYGVSSSLFPPPPPPYAFVASGESAPARATSSTPHSDQTQESAAAAAAVVDAAASSTMGITAPSTVPATITTTQSSYATAFIVKPEHQMLMTGTAPAITAVALPSVTPGNTSSNQFVPLLSNTSSSNSNAENAASDTATQQQPRVNATTWNNLFAGANTAGLTSFLLNRRTTSPSRTTRRSDSPPPAYSMSTGFATTSRR